LNLKTWSVRNSAGRASIPRDGRQISFVLTGTYILSRWNVLEPSRSFEKVPERHVTTRDLPECSTKARDTSPKEYNPSVSTVIADELRCVYDVNKFFSLLTPVHSNTYVTECSRNPHVTAYIISAQLRKRDDAPKNHVTSRDLMTILNYVTHPRDRPRDRSIGS
jgi:hypothetical protein